MNHPSYWQSEFPDHDGLPSQIAAMRHNGELVDISYHNDAMPSFVLARDYSTVDREGSAENVPVLWVDYSDESKREDSGQKRLIVQVTSSGVAFTTDDEAEAIAHLR